MLSECDQIVVMDNGQIVDIGKHSELLKHDDLLGSVSIVMQDVKLFADTIEENGAGLSGGQKQRISIVRAFLKNAPILILDEITSNVDPVNESLIQDAVSELAKNRTVIVIAHHLSTIRNADQILVFRNGKIVQSGCHQRLLSDINGYYYQLWNSGTRIEFS